MVRTRGVRSSIVVGVFLAVCFVVALAERSGLARRRADQRPTGYARIGVAAAGVEKINQVVFIIKENRTFDNYFGTFPGADGATSGTISTGDVIPLGHTPDRTPRDINHSWNSAITAIDGGAMDQFDLIPGGNVNGDYLSYTQLH